MEEKWPEEGLLLEMEDYLLKLIKLNVNKFYEEVVKIKAQLKSTYNKLFEALILAHSQ